MDDWSVEIARRFYNISQWSESCFDINSKGNVLVRCGDSDEDIGELSEIVRLLREQGLQLPVLVRFPQLLHKKLLKLQTSFDQAIQKYGYQNKYTPVYPIKVNQQATVVHELLHAEESRVGLEVGSKAELLAALGLCLGLNRPLICNGYKDRAYIRIALIGRLLGIQVRIVIEKLSELRLVAEEARRLGVQAELGVRLRLESVVSGRWQNTGGLKSKFGLRLSDILTLVEQSKAYQDCLVVNMLHFHMGSQISRLDEYESGLREAASIYRALRGLSVPLDTIDIGGGLAVDYQGTGDESGFSKSYCIEEYADIVIKTLADIFRDDDHMPLIITENGRAMVAHHAVLLANVIDCEKHFTDVPSDSKQPCVDRIPGSVNLLLRQLQENWDENIEQQLSDQVRKEFYEGNVDLHARVDLELQIERLRENYLLENNHRGLEPDHYADKYFVNFSMFQSLPDVWGLSQVFPILPIQKLDQYPSRHVRLQDLTCDSDGHLEYYVNNGKVGRTLNLHPFSMNEEYVIAVFLVGAYQEILGDMHNLFGDTHAVDIVIEESSGIRIKAIETGDRVKDLLEYVHIRTNELVERYNARFDSLDMDDMVKADLSNELKEALGGYSYLMSSDKIAR